MFEKNIEKHKTTTKEHELKNKGHFLSENKRIIHVVERAVGRSENLVGPVMMWGPDLPSLVEIVKTDRPKSGAPAPTVFEEDKSKVTEDVKKVETSFNWFNQTKQFKMEWIDSWHPEITKEQIIENIHRRKSTNIDTWPTTFNSSPSEQRP